MPDTKIAHENDVVELIEDLPEQGFKRGQRAIVIATFEHPAEAYDLEFEDNEGNFLGLAFAIQPRQLINVSRGFFEQGVEFFNKGNLTEAEELYRQAIDLNPDYIGVLHNSIMASFAGLNDFGRLITALQLVMRLNLTYKVARNNLAIAFHKCGVQIAERWEQDERWDSEEGQAQFEEALEYFNMALLVGADSDIVDGIKNSIAVIHTGLGIKAYNHGLLDFMLMHMKIAYIINPTEVTISNACKAYGHFGVALLKNERPEQAVAAFSRIQQPAVQTPEILNYYGIALVGVGKLEEAIRVFKKALRAAPDDVAIKANLSLAKSQAADINAYANEEIDMSFDPTLIRPSEYQVDLLPPALQTYLPLFAVAA